MNGLSGARVVVVDDEESEALPIIKGFSKRGIPVVYYGSISDLPPVNQQLQGIRLAILDMDLIGGGVTEKSAISALLGYLRRILHPDNGPYGILIWSKHVTFQKLFEEEIFNTTDIPNPVFTVCISKYECKDKNGNFSLKRISSKINTALKEFSPLIILQKWEEASFFSATHVTNTLANLATQPALTFDDWKRQWKTEFLQLMRTLAIAEAGQQLNSSSSLNALYESMNPLHSDRMESNIMGLRKSLSAHSAEIMAPTVTAGVHAKAKLNTMLHLSLESATNFYAGNIYTQSKLTPRIPSVKKLLEDFTDGKDEKKKKAKEELALVSKSIVIEVNAICDHSQNNIRSARFLAGIIVPEDKQKLIKRKADFVYELGPVFLESKGISRGEYYLYFSARHLLTIDLPQIINVNPIARLRGQAFGDLQSWFAHRASRPGKLILT